MEIKYEAVFGDQSLFDGCIDEFAYLVIKTSYGQKFTATHETINGVIPDYIETCGLEIAMRRIIKTPVQHSDDVAVDLFAAKMKEKLEKSRDKGRSGWESCPIEHLIASLKDHISKGDPVDVANFAMMISQRGESIKTPVWTETDRRSKKLPEVGCRVFDVTNENEATVKAINKRQVCLESIDGFIYLLPPDDIKPIESTEEKAARLREAWCYKAAKTLKNLEYSSTLISIYDALLSGDLPVPSKDEQ